jgi:hypothetical protein
MTPLDYVQQKSIWVIFRGCCSIGKHAHASLSTPGTECYNNKPKNSPNNAPKRYDLQGIIWSQFSGPTKSKQIDTNDLSIGRLTTACTYAKGTGRQIVHTMGWTTLIWGLTRCSATPIPTYTKSICPQVSRHVGS